jgi:hypothetical protein
MPMVLARFDQYLCRARDMATAPAVALNRMTRPPTEADYPMRSLAVSQSH